MNGLDPRAREVLAAVPGALRALSEENQRLATKLAAYERRDQAEEIVSIMESKGLGDASIPFSKRVASILNSQKDLGVVKEAVALAAPDMSFASISDRPEVDNSASLENYLLHGDD